MLRLTWEKILTLIDKHFSPQHKYRKLFNWNNLKVSYCCIDNMESIIKKHNAKIINQKVDTLRSMCNCRIKDKCPLNGHCLKKDIVYKAHDKTGSELRYYFGLS